MKKNTAIILASIMLFMSCSCCIPAFAEYADRLSERNEKTTLLVEFDEDTVLESSLPEDLAAENIENGREDAIEEMEDIVDGFEIGYSYTNVVNGISFDAEKGDIGKIEKLDGVVKVYEIGYVNVFQAEPVPEKVSISSGSMIGLDKVREKGLDGTGTAVAIIDGGFSCDHETMTLTNPSAAKYSKNDIQKILTSGKLSISAGVSDVYKSEKIPLAYDYCESNFDMDDFYDSSPDHGTHVAGIAAGNSNALVGIAPEAQVLMFKVDVFDEEVFVANLLAAIDDAAKFDVSSVNMSLGIDCEMADDPEYELLAKAVKTARDNGITVCTAAGNSGMYSDSVLCPDNGTNGIPNSFDGAMGIASVDNINLSPKVESPACVVYGDGKKAEITGYGLVKPLVSGKFAVVTRENYRNADVRGKYALVCEDLELDVNASNGMSEKFRDSDCLGVISAGSNYFFESACVEKKWFTILEISTLDAYRIAKCGNSSISFEKSGYYVEPAEDIHPSEYTSYGVTEDLKMSVDIAAPGGIIYSGISYSAYDVYDGTSMAAPHITGSAALMDQYISKKYPLVKGTDRSELKENLMMSTADIVPNGNVAASPRAVGAGLVDLAGAVATNTVLTDGNGTTALNLGDKIDDTVNLKFTVKNISDKEITYDGFELIVITDGYESERSFDGNTGEYVYNNVLTGKSVEIPCTGVSGIPEKITVPAESEKEFTAVASLDSSWLEANAEVFENGFYVEGYILLTDSTGTETDVNMPFMGFRGDWSQIPAVQYGPWYEDFMGMEIYVGEGYIIQRNLKSLKFECVDENGDVAAEKTLEYVMKGSFYTEDDIIAELMIDADDRKVLGGTYTLRMTAVTSDEAEPQITEFENMTVHAGMVELWYAESERKDDGVYEVKIACKSDNITYFEIAGASILNMNYFDLCPVDECDYTDENGYKVYVLHDCRYPVSAVTITGYNDDGYLYDRATLGNISALVRFIRAIKSFFASIRSLPF